MQWITRASWKGHLIALLAGALTPLFLAPFTIWPLALISIGIFYLGLTKISATQSLIRGWCYGFGAYITGVSWIYVSINTYGNAPIWLAALLTIVFCMSIALFFAIPAFIWSKYFRTEGTYFTDAFAFAGMWAIQEWFRGWFLTGFPWLYTGYSQIDGPLAGFAPIGGIWFISFLLAFITVVAVKLHDVKKHQPKLIAGIVTILALPLLGLLLNHINWTTITDKKIAVTLIQGNVDQIEKWDEAYYNKQFNLYWKLTQENQRENSLVIWPENAIPFLKESVQKELDNAIGTFEKKYQSTLITGLPVRQANKQGENRYYNGITTVGEGEGTYFKQKLVPFGEYVPLEETLRGLITFFDLPMSNFSKGSSNQPLLKVKDFLVAPFICYEVVYPDFVASLAVNSDLLITISNDTWFGHSIGPKQHMQMVQMRALEAGRWMVRSTNNGITAIIDNKGRIVKQLPQFKTDVLQGEAFLATGKTPYLIWQSWPVLLISSLGLILALYTKKRKKLNLS